MDYDVMQPFGDKRANWHAALLAHVFAAAHTRRGRQPMPVSAFMYEDEETRRQRHTADIDQFFARVTGHGKPS